MSDPKIIVTDIYKSITENEKQKLLTDNIIRLVKAGQMKNIMSERLSHE